MTMATVPCRARSSRTRRAARTASRSLRTSSAGAAPRSVRRSAARAVVVGPPPIRRTVASTAARVASPLAPGARPIACATASPIAANGGRSPNGTQRPTRKRPGGRECPSSSASRLLPIPGSPTTASTRDRPRRSVSSSSRPSSPNMSSRSTNVPRAGGAVCATGPSASEVATGAALPLARRPRAGPYAIAPSVSPRVDAETSTWPPIASPAILDAVFDRVADHREPGRLGRRRHHDLSRMDPRVHLGERGPRPRAR